MSEQASKAPEKGNADIASPRASAYETLLALAFAERQVSDQPAHSDPIDLEQTEEDPTDSRHIIDGTRPSVLVPLVDGLASYRNRLNRISLLTQEQEVDFARRVEAGVLAAQALLDGAPERSRGDLVLIRQQGADAYSSFVTANLRLVVYWASRYRAPGLEFEDAIQEGNLGLLKAVQMYDYRKGFKFSTYASWWIKQHISRGAADQGRTIRLPVYVHERLSRLQRALRAAGGAMDISEVVLEMATVGHAEAQDLLTWSLPVWSLDELIEHGLLLDIPVEPFFEGDLEAVLHHVVIRRALEAALLQLTPRERRILELRYGLTDGAARTLEEVGLQLGLTRERIRQIESKAKERLAAQAALRSAWAAHELGTE